MTQQTNGPNIRSSRPRTARPRATTVQEITDLVSGPPQVLAETTEVLLTIGGNIRRLRIQRGSTLQALATATGLSSSMLSLLERGKTGPSIGTLVAIASALDAQMLDLLGAQRGEDQPVTRRDKQLVYTTAKGVQRRVLKNDAENEVEIAINEYEPGTASAAQPVAHKGYEFGIVLEGELQITLNEQAYVLAPGDLISYRSTDPHRIANPTKQRAKALWVNMRGR